jgi:hypothetical protein
VSGEPDADALAEELMGATVALTLSLHDAIADLARDGVALHAAAPIAAIFEQPPGAKPRHRSGRPSGELVALAADVAERVRELAGYEPGEDNPALEPLALACFYVVDARRSNAFGLEHLAAARPIARVVDADEAHRDPVFPVGTALIRIWSELDGEPPMCVELALRG